MNALSVGKSLVRRVASTGTTLYTLVKKNMNVKFVENDLLRKIISRHTTLNTLV